MRHVYSSRLVTQARKTAKENKVQLFEGTYWCSVGPTYETWHEVETGAKWGIGAFGMSTIPEAMAAFSEGLEVFACSMVTNLAAGIDDSSMHLTHEDVTETAGEFAPQFTKVTELMHLLLARTSS
jgi:purine-nucleoside phosphorylase